jgi:hypothetical protein
MCLKTSVTDPHHSDADPDPTFQFDAYPDQDLTTHFQIWTIQCSKMTLVRLQPLHFDADPDPDFHCHMDPDPSFHF